MCVGGGGGGGGGGGEGGSGASNKHCLLTLLISQRFPAGLGSSVG